MLRMLAGALALLLAANASAQTPSYSFVEGGFQRVDLDSNFGADLDGDGFSVGGSYEVAPNWHIFGNFSSTGLDFNIDLDQLTLGGGYHADVSPISSFYANLAFIDADVGASGFGSVSESGYGIQVGLRSMVSPRLELEGYLSHVDLGGGVDGTGVGGSALYHFGRNFAAGLTIDLEEDSTAYALGARLYFGRQAATPYR